MTTPREPRRRGKGVGQIRERPDGRWEARLRSDGSRRGSLYGHTRREVVAKLTAHLKAKAEGLEAINGRQRLEGYLRDWLRITSPTLRPSSAQRYELAIRRHIVDVVGQVPLTRLGPQHIQALHSALIDKGLAPATVGHVHSVLNAALADAERWGRIARNPVRLVSPPRVPRRQMKPLSRDEALQLITAAEDAPLGPLFTLLLATGLRVGEALALRWSEIDLEAGDLQVLATMSRAQKGFTRAEPKTTSGRRLVLLPDDAVSALHRQRARQNEQRLAAGRAWIVHGYVFTDAIGRPLNPGGIVTRSWKALLLSCRLADRRLHDLRHSFATLQLEQGTPAKVVQEALGHSNIGITMNLYSHVTPTMQEQARAAMNRVFER